MYLKIFFILWIISNEENTLPKFYVEVLQMI